MLNHFVENGEEKSAIFSFDDWAKNIKDKKLLNEHLNLSKCKASIEYLRHNKSTGIWKTRLLRLGEYNIPQKSKNSKVAEDIKLDPDEYLGYDVNIIYDETYGIAMIQRNRMSLSIERIAELIESTFPATGRTVTIEPIFNLEGSKIDANGRKIEVSFANIVGEIPETESSFSDIVNAYYRLNAMVGTISLGVGRGKEITTVKSDGKDKKIKTERYLDKKEYTRFVNDIRDNSRIVSRGVLTLKDEESASVEIVDLFNDVFADTITYKLEAKQTLGVDYAMNQMIDRYNARKVNIVKSLYKKE